MASLVAALIVACAPARAWDSATHRAIVRLAVEALPPSPLKTTLSHNEPSVEEYSVEPDSILKKEFGKAEERRHYINVEDFGSNPWVALNPDIEAMRRRFGDRTVDRAGTLPWTIVGVGADLEDAWRRGGCERILRNSGYFAHYVGDASQPLHSTVLFDGYRRDGGVHARFELAADDSLTTLTPMAAREVHIESINDPWTAVIAEIRDANGHVQEVIRDDRSAREQSDGKAEYRSAMLRADAPMVARQIARAVSVLASLWLYEWRRAGSPASCAQSNHQNR